MAMTAPEVLPNEQKNGKIDPSLNFERYGILRKYIPYESIHPRLATDKIAAIIFGMCQTITSEKRIPKLGLALYGSRGTGKTGAIMHVAKAAAKLCNDNDKLEMSCQDFWSFMHNVRTGFGSHTPYVKNLVDQNDFVFLDDVGKVETDAGWMKDSFRELVDGVFNYGQGKILCFTSNLSREGLAQLFGEPCLDRIDEICYTQIMTGQSLR
jgi:DNA replication protein DnaC